MLKILKNIRGGVIFEYVAITVIIGSIYLTVFIGMKETVHNMFLAKQTYDERVANDKYCEYTNNYFDDSTKTEIQYKWDGDYNTSGNPSCKQK
ncbi:hypothetical protein KHQ81_15535 (plasmid) [Mycoplasmatota bacterium]|nr:hypothetical protein KHQ81_15535 [Mycoplasmatota bacterium]